MSHTFFWVPGRNTAYDVESAPFVDAFSGRSPTHNFIAALYDAPDGMPHEMFGSYREMLGYFAAQGIDRDSLKFVRL